MFFSNFSDRLRSKFLRGYLSITGVRTVVCRRNGARFRLNMDKSVDYRFYLGEFERGNLDYFLSHIKPDDVVIDVGANIGIYAILAAKRTGIAGKVIAFEPAEKAFESLRNNISLNRLPNVSAVRLGVSDAKKEMIFNVCEDDAYNSLGSAPMQKATRSVRINTINLDAFAEEMDLGRVDVLKVDTEGAEYLVFKCAEKLLRKFRPKIFFEFNPYTAPGFDFDQYESINFLRTLGYSFLEFIDGKPLPIEGNNVKTFDIIGIP